MFWSEYPRDVVQVAGPDAASYLQSQLSQDLRPLQVGQSTWSFVLQPTGKVDVLLRVWRTGDETFVLDTDAGFGETMVARLNRFKIRVKADITPLEWTCIAVRGATAADDVSDVAWSPGVAATTCSAPHRSPPAVSTPGTTDDLLAARVEAAWPAMGAEIVPGETIPAETGVTAWPSASRRAATRARSWSSAWTAGPSLRRNCCNGSARLRPRRSVLESPAPSGDAVLAYVPRAALQS